jgi:immune inhibitor A
MTENSELAEITMTQIMPEVQEKDEVTGLSTLRAHPPHPWHMANYYADYKADKEIARATHLTFKQYLSLTHKSKGCLEHCEVEPSLSTSSIGSSSANAAPAPPSRVMVPNKPLKGELRVKVLLIDFPDRPGLQPAKYYQRMLFSDKVLPTGSMADYYKEVSGGNLTVAGSVHGWIRMPRDYTYYTNKQSGMEWTSYPKNAPRMAEDAVNEALKLGVKFEADLDALKNGIVTALFIIHAGRGAEALPPREGKDNIWSHKWNVRTPIKVRDDGLKVETYLTVPEDCMVGVCAHELGHLAMGWDDFYDPNYNEDGQYWDGSGNWDLMAGGSWAGSGARPVHPAGVHKLQHNWVKSEVLDMSLLKKPKTFRLVSFKDNGLSTLKIIKGRNFNAQQYLLLECRKRVGFDSELPGEGLLVWRVDIRQQQNGPDLPALLLVQADGMHDLEDGFDNNAGDGGDPFPGTYGRTQLLDSGDISTSFPGQGASGINITNISRDTLTGAVTFTVSAAVH